MSDPLPNDNRCKKCGMWYHNAHACLTTLPAAQAAPVTASELNRFEAWARLHFGQGYGFQKEEGTYISAVTRWAAKAFNAGFDLAMNSPRAAPVAAEPIAWLCTRPSGLAWALMPREMTPETRKMLEADNVVITPLVRPSPSAPKGEGA
jgi:hypothetical protein